ncbi:hypothetical protein B4U80_03797 [Leptotrombidium deliense]|uniref:Uncharacterized protein n=1 Tax=Leptotrombidium deliense TaxID=299467 RepID=A0A443SQV7_9ACAR|nr:hypothetical protein B4U80_03797 [Leptotrombidium deliense]
MTASKSATEIRCSSIAVDTSCSAISDLAKLGSLHPDGVQLQSPPWLPRTCRSGSAGSSLLAVPSEKYGSRRYSSGVSGFNKFSHEILFEEEVDVIKNCGAFSSAVLGLMKSFSTSDISTVDPFNETPLRSTYSEIALFGGILWNAKLELPTIRRLDAHSRSCSTWVAVGEPISSTSQLPSPQTHTVGSDSVTGHISPLITPTDLLQSVNKKVRQMYIKRRLLSTYRALERLSRSQLDLNNVVKGELDLFVSSQSPFNNKSKAAMDTNVTVDVENADTAQNRSAAQLHVSVGESNTSSSNNNTNSKSSKRNKSSHRLSNPLDLHHFQPDLSSLSIRDVDLQKGKPLTKYERNIMIFNWLQNLDQTDCKCE